MSGQLGFNLVPSARMDEAGTARIGLSTLDPYVNGFIGFQVADPLYISLRQTGNSSDITGDPKRLYPGVDFKLRLLTENRYRPEVSVGIQSATGHKRTGGEYLVASKRYNNFDFSAGIGWGRYGSAGHFENPLKGISNHFGKTRDLDGENPIAPNDWFTGEDIGLFAGIEYFMPWDGVSVKADWGADRNEAERAAYNVSNAAPWSLAVNYAPVHWADMSLGIQGTDKIMARISFQNNIDRWPGHTYKATDPPPLNAVRAGNAEADDLKHDAWTENITIDNVHYDTGTTQAALTLDRYKPSALQIGRAARHMANNSPEDTESFRLQTFHSGLRGPTLTLIRRDFETALLHKQGSPEEIWHNTSISSNSEENGLKTLSDKKWNFRLILDNDLSLSEEDTGVIYRTAVLVDGSHSLGLNVLGGNIITGGRLRLNLKDNLHRLRDFRPSAPMPVRSDIDTFTEEIVTLDRSYFGWFKTLNTDLHLGLTAGYLEEMYAGFGGELLYRPFGKTYGLGAEAWQVFKRDPGKPLNLNLNGDHLLTGHIKAFYEVPNTSLTASAEFGRYLAEDVGGGFALEKRFKNGAKLKAFVTATDQSDYDVFGSTTNLYSGLNLTVPIGNIKYLGKGSEIRVNARPLGRDTGQRIDQPLPLYEMTEPLSYREITQQWNEILN